MDVPDSSDYWHDIQEQLVQDGVPVENILPISAATGEGVIELVRRLRAVLDALPPVVSLPTNSLNCDWLNAIGSVSKKTDRQTGFLDLILYVKK